MKKVGLTWLLLIALIAIGVSAGINSQTYLPIAYRQPTPTATQAIPPTQEPYPYGVQYLPDINLYTSGSLIHILGEVLNNTSDSLFGVGVGADFYDAYGQLQGGSVAIMTPLDLPAGERGCFEIMMNEPDTWSYYELEPVTYTLGTSSAGLIILEHAGAYDIDTGSYGITGQVRNDGDQISLNVSVGGTLYDADHMPVGCEFILVDSQDLNTGQGSYFTLDYSGSTRDYLDVTEYRLRVTGDIY
ncbi:MAG: hypothetical protein ACM3H7_00950 [Acidobacteriaceae bacterium]